MQSNVAAWPSSLIRFDVCGHDASVGLSEPFNVNFGADSERTVLLFKLCRLGYDDRSLGNHPNPEKSTSGQLLNDSFKFDVRRFICSESRQGRCDSDNKRERDRFHTEQSSISN